MYFTPRRIGKRMKIAARYLVRLENTGRTVGDYLETRREFRGMLSPIGCHVNSTRISGIAVEVDFFSSGREEAAEGIEKLRAAGHVLSVTDLMSEEEAGPVEGVMQEARRLFNEERFWEVHETVEGIWRKAAGEEKKVQQSIILYASALVHYQKNETETTLRMLGRSLELMKSGGEKYHCFNLSLLRSEAERMIREGRVRIFRLGAA